MLKTIISDNCCFKHAIVLSQGSEEVDTGSPPSSNNFDCGQTVSPNDQEISCGEHASSFTKTPENSQCLWHFNVIHFKCMRFGFRNVNSRLMKDTEDK